MTWVIGMPGLVTRGVLLGDALAAFNARVRVTRNPLHKSTFAQAEKLANRCAARHRPHHRPEL